MSTPGQIKEFDYDSTYGWTPNDQYEVSEVCKADVEDSGVKAMAEQRNLACKWSGKKASCNL
jgi:hypothetical protein